MGKKTNGWQLLLHAILVVIVLMTIYPLVSMIFKSFKSFDQSQHSPWGLSFPLHFENYAVAWDAVRPFIWNTVIIAVVATLGIVVISAATGFVLARFDFPGKEMIFYIIISLMMIPGILSLIPLFILIRDLELINTKAGLIGPYIAGGIPFGVFLMRNFMGGISKEMFEAASMDGASLMRLFTHIAVPLSRPIISTLVILNILNFWNDFVLPSIVTLDDAQKTVAIGLLAFNNAFNLQQGPQFAGYILSSLPLIGLFVIASKQFIAGMTSGAMKL